MTTRPGFVWDATASEWVEIGPVALTTAKVSYQASAPSSPATGDIWVDADDEVPGITSSLNYRWRKIAAGGETSLSGNDTSGLPLAYNPGYEQVYLNGVLLYRGSDYVATTGNTITGLTALVANDTIEVLSFVTAPIGDTYTQAAADAKFTAQSGSVLQVVQGTATATVSNSTGTQALTGLNVTFTPKYANSKLLFTYCVNGIYVSTSGLGALFTLRTGNTANSGTVLTTSTVSQGFSNSDSVSSHSMSFLYTPPSAMSGAQTFSVQFNIGQGSGTVFCQSSSPMSTLIVQEIGA
jgi:hypothetical protein